jgi:hypothetical protein
MARRASLLPFAWILAALAFAAALAHLYQLRFDSGEVYPPYSSLRADPLGCRALYESLDAVGGLELSRNYEQLPALDNPRGLALCVFGIEPRQLYVSQTEARDLNAFVRQGGRLLVTFEGTTGTNRWWSGIETNVPLSKLKSPKKKDDEQKPKPGKKKTATDDKKKKSGDDKKKVADNKTSDDKKKHDETEKTEPSFMKAQNLAADWGVQFDLAMLHTNAMRPLPQALIAANAPTNLPRVLPWHSTLVFTNLNPAWKILYSRDRRPVLIERAFGNGAIVFAADTYLVSNEALLRDRQPALLSWMIGSASRVCFDETHLGVADEPGTATLIRKYRLHGLLAALTLLAVLLLWRQSSPFVPSSDDSVGGQSHHVAGRTAASGFVNLLRRSIAPRDLPRVCLAEWRKSFAHNPRCRADVIERAEETINAADARDPVATYHTVHRLVSERKKL